MLVNIHGMELRYILILQVVVPSDEGSSHMMLMASAPITVTAVPMPSLTSILKTTTTANNEMLQVRRSH